MAAGYKRIGFFCESSDAVGGGFLFLNMNELGVFRRRFSLFCLIETVFCFFFFGEFFVGVDVDGSDLFD